MKRLGCVIGVKENEEKEKQPVDDNVAVKRGADSRLLFTESFSGFQMMMTLCSLLCSLLWGRVGGKKSDKTSVMERNDGVGGRYIPVESSGPPAAG
ncbi:hypothetical protein TESG_08365 [Trichophyton tonsurans CBS 112818]|uniref:Uncharacterized protein n=2 Tax=Trichophyton TaxID=5550 RepID=F2PPB9_TRIEC|nr:hypothetical protein TESG_08365 [Trichophyton tonsurans CBS 112818]EGE03737.1 hypothetical protein TEQG_08640 [Trichophyton equinum CBS 127.97]